MPRTARPKPFQQRNLLGRQDVDALFPEPPPVPEVGDRLLQLPIADLWLDDQPRQIVPPDTLARLIAEDRAQPAALLAALQEAAESHPYYRGVLQGIHDLARTVAAEGVLEPLLVVLARGRYVVRDGHRRTLASLLAQRDTVPARLLDEDSDVQAAARQLVVNLQRSDLTAIEKGRWLLRLARLVERQIRDELGLPPAPSVVEALVARPNVERGPADTSAADPFPDLATAAEAGVDGEEAPRGATAAERDLAARVRQRVCELSGLSPRHYYNLIYLNRLGPRARELGLGLTEGQLRPVTSLPPEEQTEIVAFIAQRNLTAKEATTLVQVARSGDRDAVRRVMARLAREENGRQRAAVSWEPLLHALPRDLWPRCAALRAELGALSDELRQVRLRAMWEQRRLAEELIHQFDEIFEVYGYVSPPSASLDTATDQR